MLLSQKSLSSSIAIYTILSIPSRMLPISATTSQYTLTIKSTFNSFQDASKITNSTTISDVCYNFQFLLGCFTRRYWPAGYTAQLSIPSRMLQQLMKSSHSSLSLTFNSFQDASGSWDGRQSRPQSSFNSFQDASDTFHVRFYCGRCSFQFLLGCFKCMVLFLSSYGKLKLSIPSRMLQQEEQRPKTIAEWVFQFLLGCFDGTRVCREYLRGMGLSIPSRMLRQTASPPKGGSGLRFQFLLGCFLALNLHKLKRRKKLSIPSRMLRLITAPFGAVVIYTFNSFQDASTSYYVLALPLSEVFQFLLGCFIIVNGTAILYQPVFGTFNSFQDASTCFPNSSNISFSFQFLLGCFIWLVREEEADGTFSTCFPNSSNISFSFQFLLGCFRKKPKKKLKKFLDFQFLLGCFFKNAHKQGLSSVTFQFLLGCFLGDVIVIDDNPEVLSIPSRMLQHLTEWVPGRHQPILSIPSRMLQFTVFAKI